MSERDIAADPDADAEAEERQVMYVESTIIMTTVRVVAPFVLTFGLFVMFHGADSPGGGFQGGVLAGSVIMMLAFAFGIESTREWLSGRTVAAMAGGGVLVFAGVGLGTLALGGTFLEYHVYEEVLGIYHASKYGIELVELAIGGVVAGVVVGLFFAIAAGFEAAVEGGDQS